MPDFPADPDTINVDDFVNIYTYNEAYEELYQYLMQKLSSNELTTNQTSKIIDKLQFLLNYMISPHQIRLRPEQINEIIGTLILLFNHKDQRIKNTASRLMIWIIDAFQGFIRGFETIQKLISLLEPPGFESAKLSVLSCLSHVTYSNYGSELFHELFRKSLQLLDLNIPELTASVYNFISSYPNEIIGVLNAVGFPFPNLLEHAASSIPAPAVKNSGYKLLALGIKLSPESVIGILPNISTVLIQDMNVFQNDETSTFIHILIQFLVEHINDASVDAVVLENLINSVRDVFRKKDESETKKIIDTYLKIIEAADPNRTYKALLDMCVECLGQENVETAVIGLKIMRIIVSCHNFMEFTIPVIGNLLKTLETFITSTAPCLVFQVIMVLSSMSLYPEQSSEDYGFVFNNASNFFLDSKILGEGTKLIAKIAAMRDFELVDEFKEFVYQASCLETTDIDQDYIEFVEYISKLNNVQLSDAVFQALLYAFYKFDLEMPRIQRCLEIIIPVTSNECNEEALNLIYDCLNVMKTNDKFFLLPLITCLLNRKYPLIESNKTELLNFTLNSIIQTIDINVKQHSLQVIPDLIKINRTVESYQEILGWLFNYIVEIPEGSLKIKALRCIADILSEMNEASAQFASNSANYMMCIVRNIAGYSLLYHENFSNLLTELARIAYYLIRMRNIVQPTWAAEFYITTANLLPMLINYSCKLEKTFILHFSGAVKLLEIKELEMTNEIFSNLNPDGLNFMVWARLEFDNMADAKAPFELI